MRTLWGWTPVLICVQMPNWVLMFGVSDLCTKPDCVKLRFCFVLFLVRMCDLNACLRFNFPVPVTVKRFFALLLVFIFGMSSVSGGSGFPSPIFLLFRADCDEHPLPFQLGHQLHGSNVLKLLRKTQQQNLSPLLKDNASSSEEDMCLQLVPLLQKLPGVFHLEVEIMIVRIRAEPDLFLSHLGLVRFDFFLLLLLVIQKFLIVQNSAHRRIRLWRNLHEVQFLCFCHFNGIVNIDDIGIANIVSHQTHLGRPNFSVCPVRVFLDHPGWATGSSASNSDGAISLVVQSFHLRLAFPQPLFRFGRQTPRCLNLLNHLRLASAQLQFLVRPRLLLQ